MVEIFDASPKSLSVTRGRSSPDHPFEKLEVGKCFIVKHEAIKSGSLRNKASIVGKKLGRKFTVVDHGDVYEVARIK